MKIRINDDNRWAFGILVLTAFLALLKIFGIINIPWLAVTFMIWFPLSILSMVVFVFFLLILIAILLPKKPDTEDEQEPNFEEYNT